MYLGFQKVRMSIKIGALKNRTLGDATIDHLLNMYTPQQRTPAINLKAADLTVDDLKSLGFKIIR